MIGLLLLAGAAQAEVLDLDKDIYQCTPDDMAPIWGSAGYSNALEAFRTNATTWSSTRFAEEKLLSHTEALDGEDGGVFAWQFDLSYNVARLPVYSKDAGAECPWEYRISERVIDMQAHNLGVAFRVGRVGAFYASSVTFGAPAQDPFSRGMLWSMGAPIYAFVPLMTAPLTGSFQNQIGASAYAQEYILGLSADLDVADLNVGYTRSRGLYASAFEKRLGLYGTLVLRDRLSTIGQAEAGLRRLTIADGAGATSLFGRALPLTESVDTDAADDQPGVIQQLLTGNVVQEGIGGYVDLDVAYAVSPEPLLHKALIAVHSVNFLENGGLRLQGGMVTLPRMAWYGVDGGRFPSVRADGDFRLLDGDADVLVNASLLYNDAEQLALYPFAENAISARFSMETVW